MLPSSRILERRRSPGFPAGAFTSLQLAIPALKALATWWVSLRVEGPPLPEGPVVVSSNHLSHVDPVMVSIAAGRPIRFLALDELYGQNQFFDMLTLWLGSIPLSRTGVPLGAMRTALAELAAGGTVGMFPEGRRVATWGDEFPRRGAAWLAHRAGVPLVPVALAGTGEVLGFDDWVLRRRPVTATVCDPIYPGDFEGATDSVTAMTEEWSRRVAHALG